MFARSGNTGVWRVTCFLLKLSLLWGVGVITDVWGEQVSKLNSLRHVEGDLKFLAWEMYMLIGKNAFSSLQAKF